jgi:hypothetical protein
LNLKKISLCRLLNPYALHRLMGTSLWYPTQKTAVHIMNVIMEYLF